MYVLYSITRDGRTYTMYEADTFKEVRDYAIKHGYRTAATASNFHAICICNTERMDLDKEDGLTDEERENLPPGL